MSLDPGTSSSDERSNPFLRVRGLEDVRDELTESLKTYPDRHWAQVHVLTIAILSRWIEHARLGAIDALAASEWFAATNAVRCCANLRGGAQGPEIMYKNCGDYVLGELEVLKADVLVTLGDSAMDAVRAAIAQTNLFVQISAKPPWHGQVQIDNRLVEWIALTHPGRDRFTRKGQKPPYKTQRDTFVPPCVDEIWSRWWSVAREG